MHSLHLNLILAWVWISLGFLSGLVLGLFFHDEHWLGGYATLKRRLYRLAHISFFGLGIANLCFYWTARSVSGPATWSIPSWSFIIGALTMPLCCVLMAHLPRARSLFAVPVLSLLLGGILTVIALVQATPEVHL
jgi:hypothetical protein